jgi:very-short-patch-repair endonuclease
MGGMSGTARILRKNPTDAERALWRRLRLRQIAGCRFRRQHPLGPYVADFVCLNRKLIVEVDGGQHAAQVTHDTERTTWLEGRGYRVVRFWDNEVLRDPDSVAEVIRQALTPHLNPPPQGGRRPRL